MDERRTGTREQIRTLALELFAERGYDATSLREIAERLGITKAAVYYHFKTKEEILASLVDDFFAEIDELVNWAQHQPASAATREQVLRRYHALLRERATPLAQLLHEGQAALRDVAAGAQLRSRFDRLADLLVDCGDRGDPIDARLRARLAFVALHMGAHRFGAGNEEARQAALQIALDLVSRSPDSGSRGN
ncbi:MAG TPA: TetR family transcriptional regulator [Pseudonocardiaceae bacterium]